MIHYFYKTSGDVSKFKSFAVIVFSICLVLTCINRPSDDGGAQFFFTKLRVVQEYMSLAGVPCLFAEVGKSGTGGAAFKNLGKKNCGSQVVDFFGI